MTSEAFDKFHLLKDEEYQRLRQKQVQSYNPELRILTRLDDEIKELLNDTNVPVDVKVNIFNQLQQRIKDVQAITKPVSGVTKVVSATEVAGPPTTTPVVVANADGQEVANMEELPKEVVKIETKPQFEPIDDSILNEVGIKTKKKATEMLEKIQAQPEVIAKNENNEIVLNGHVIKGSNFNDLFKSLYTQSFDSSQQGQIQFLKALNKLDIPLSLVSNTKTRNKLSELRIHSPLGKAPILNLTTPSTPVSTALKRKPNQSGNGLTPGKMPSILRVYRC